MCPFYNKGISKSRCGSLNEIQVIIKYLNENSIKSE